jgi:hypothetical protein
MQTSCCRTLAQHLNLLVLYMSPAVTTLFSPDHREGRQRLLWFVDGSSGGVTCFSQQQVSRLQGLCMKFPCKRRGRLRPFQAPRVVDQIEYFAGWFVLRPMCMLWPTSSNAYVAMSTSRMLRVSLALNALVSSPLALGVFADVSCVELMPMNFHAVVDMPVDSRKTVAISWNAQ